MTKIRWHKHCAKHDKDIGFGIYCYACPDIKPPEINRFHPDARLCIHERYIEETAKKIEGKPLPDFT